jgi:hypothetical protein
LTDASPIVDANALEGFCADFQTNVAANWPNVDATTASTMAAALQDRMDDPAMASVQSDLSTITTWLGSVATQSAIGTPPPEVSTAFDDLTAFADSSC